jgi:hypothetical protein
VAVKLEGTLPAALNAELGANRSVRSKVHATVGPLHIDASRLSFERTLDPK